MLAGPTVHKIFVFFKVIANLESDTNIVLRARVYMYGFAAALFELPFNFVQMTVGGIVGIPLAFALKQRF